MARLRFVTLSVLSLVLVVVLAACSSSSPMGSLKVLVSGLPSGVSGTVLVTGPAGYSKAVTATTTLSVPPGTYSISAAAARGANTIVPVVYDASASSSSVNVTADATASSTVTYAVRPGSGHLWVPMYTSLEAESYANGDLAASGSPSPDVTLGSSSHYGEAVAFDGAGNMWVGDYTGFLYRYDAASLGTSGTPTPSVTIDATAYSTELYALAFDAAGDLWISTYDNDTLVMYTPSQLSTGGALTATVVISDDGSGSLSGPGGIAFDSAGGLWVADYSNDTLVKFSPAQLASSGTPTPAVTLSATAGGSIAEPNDVAFDSSGDLWVSNDNTGTIVRFDASQLASSGTPTPATTIASSSLGGNPTGLAFDASGNLWVSDYTSTDLRQFTNPGALTGSVTPAADVTVSSIGSVDYPLIAFDPPPANLPINTP